VSEKAPGTVTDVELDKEQELGKKTGKVVDKPKLGRESCDLYQNPVFRTYGSTWSERTGCGVQTPGFPSDIQFFLRPVFALKFGYFWCHVECTMYTIVVQRRLLIIVYSTVPQIIMKPS
jgi:hypothetical protein